MLAAAGVIGLLALFAASIPAAGQKVGHASRKIKVQVPPEYPQLARDIGLRGVARVQITIAPDGTVKEVKELGGHPLLVQALTNAVKKWKYEPSDETTVLEVRSEFPPSQ